MSALAKEIFKAYDIRGVVGTTLFEATAEGIGHALVDAGRARGVSAIVIGRDGRLSGPSLAAALARGIRAAGLSVIDLGAVATPLAYFAAHELGTGSCVMVTGSHNPPDYNGFKMVLAGETLYGAAIQDLRTRIEAGFTAHATQGSYKTHDIAQTYFARILGDVKLKRPMKLAIDCGNGVPGAFAPELFRRLGCEVTEMYCEVDGHFPNHHPDPAHPENLQDLIAQVKASDAELGLAFDGDGDRLGLVTKEGNIIYPDRQLLLYAEDVLKRNPGATIIYDVKSTRNLGPWITARGGVPLLWKTGHSLIKAKMKETGALLAGEMSGHTFFKERWYGFDDALYCGARLLEILSAHADPSAVLNALPDAASTPELNWKLPEGEHYAVIERLQAMPQANTFPDAERIVTIDGVRVEYKDGFGLARASNTTPVVVLRFEADNEVAFARIQDDMRQALQLALPGAVLPF